MYVMDIYSVKQPQNIIYTSKNELPLLVCETVTCLAVFTSGKAVQLTWYEFGTYLHQLQCVVQCSAYQLSAYGKRNLVFVVLTGFDVYSCHIHMILVKIGFIFENYGQVFGLLGQKLFHQVPQTTHPWVKVYFDIFGVQQIHFFNFR